jgi:carboxypeptidase C (cathepsin A)
MNAERLRLRAGWSGLLAMCFGLALPASLARAEEKDLVTTRHQVQAKGGVLRYTARAGLIPIRNNEDGELRGKIFFVSYTSDRGPGQPPRPLTFAWNGGPGSNSVLVHLVGFGPRRLRSCDDPAKPVPVAPVLEDNESTWLDVTDLVFVDPVGTGFSRPSQARYAASFYSTLGDIASIAEFVRVYCLRFDVADAPVFLAGESYGTWRASGVAEALERNGQRVAGVMLISGGIQMGPVLSNPVRAALFVPSRTATAFYHKKLVPELMQDEQETLQATRKWALQEYAPALERAEALTDGEREKVITQLARYTGVNPSSIDWRSLAMTSPQFRTTLLLEQKVTLARYDMRLTSQTPVPEEPARSLAIGRYLRGDLQFKTDLAYQGIESGYSPEPALHGASIGQRWKWDQGEQAGGTSALASSTVGSGDGPPGGSQPWLRRAMLLNPALKVFVAAGLYDSLNSCAGNDHLVATLEPHFRRRFTTGCYRAGHVMYDTKEARLKLQQDIAAFIKNATPPTR